MHSNTFVLGIDEYMDLCISTHAVYFMPRKANGSAITTTYKKRECNKFVREPHFQCAPLATPEQEIKMQDMHISLQQAMKCCASKTVA